MQTIQTKYIHPTNHRGERIQAKASGGICLTVSWDYSQTPTENHLEAVRQLKEKLGWSDPMIGADYGTGYIFIHPELQID